MNQTELINHYNISETARGWLEKLLALFESDRIHPRQFEMSASHITLSRPVTKRYLTCDSAHCLGGWLAVLLDSPKLSAGEAGEAAGLEKSLINDLFYPDSDSPPWRSVTRTPIFDTTLDDAVAVLKHVLE